MEVGQTGRHNLLGREYIDQTPSNFWLSILSLPMLNQTEFAIVSISDRQMRIISGK